MLFKISENNRHLRYTKQPNKVFYKILNTYRLLRNRAQVRNKNLFVPFFVERLDGCIIHLEYTDIFTRIMIKKNGNL